MEIENKRSSIQKDAEAARQQRDSLQKPKTPSDTQRQKVPGAGKIRQTLKRFHDELASAPPSSVQNRFLKLNERRVAEFIDKPYVDRINEASISQENEAKKRQQRQSRVPGVYIYPPREEFRSLIQKQNALEFDKALGDHSRFGDGDGSFFDRFVNSTSTTISRYTCDKDGFPIVRSDIDMAVGFKRHYIAHREGKDATTRRTVMPYEERRRLRKEAEQREKDLASGVRADEGAKTGGSGTGLMDVQWEESQNHGLSLHSSFVQRHKPRTPKLPPLLTEEVKDTYFGDKGRATFFDYYRQISRQQYILNQRSTGPDKDLLGMLSIKDENPERERYKEGLVSNLENIYRGVVSREADAADEHSGRARFSSTPVNEALAERFQDIVSDAGRQFEDMHLSRPGVLGSNSSSSSNSKPFEAVSTKVGEKSGSRGGEGVEHTASHVPISARTHFIANCISNNLNPRPALIVRRDVMEILDISGQGIGDSVAVMLAESIPRLPLLEALNVRQNNLTEKGMLAVVHAVSTCSSLTSVDLSENKLTEPVAERLSQYLRSKSCALEYLILQKCDLDDACACRILEVIDCRTIRHLDFSSNRVGSNETMRSAILGEVYTAGDAFASLLSSSTCPLETLKLSWNMIRMQSAASLARSIRNNKSLVHLDLSYNSLGDEAGQILGDALHSHKSLQYLNLTQNNICAKGCFTIVSGIKTCKTLHTVDLSENPIGDFGSRAVMALDVTAGDEVTVLVNGCLLTLRDDKLTFDPSNPIGTYELDLGNPYSRALCIELLRVVADNEHVSIAKAVQTENNTTTELHFSVKKRLKKSRTGREIDMPDEEHIHQIAADIDSAKKLFHRYDEDENGVLDRNEITKMLTDLGLTTSDETVDEMLRFYDFDGRDNIGIGEFSSFLQNVCDAANTAKAWLTEERFIVAGAPGAAAAPPAKGSKYSTLKEYLPPDRGHMHIECVGDQKMPAFLQLASPANVTRIISAMKAVSNGEAMIEHALTSMKLKFEEANKLYRILLKEVGDKVAVLRRLLPRMATYPDAAQLVTAACGGNIRERMHLRRLIGDSFFLLFTGSPNGFYSVNLAEETSKICLKRLIELDAEAAHMRKKRGLGDTSQYANWSGFRNTVLDNTPVILDTEFFDKLPEKGRLEFDFVYMNGVAASEASHAIPDERLFNLLQGLDMVRKDERQYVMTRMKTLREESKAASRGLGVGFQQVDSAAARAIRINLDELHQKVQTRSVDADRTRIDMDTREAPIYADELSSPSRTMKSQTVSRDASRVVSRIVSQTASRVVSRRGTVRAPDNAGFAGSELGLYADFMRKLKSSEAVNLDHYATRMSDCIRDLLVGRLITCSQLAVVLDSLATINPTLHNTTTTTAAVAALEDGDDEKAASLVAAPPPMAPVSLAAKLSTVVKSYTGESNIAIKDARSAASGTATPSIAVLNNYGTARTDLVLALYTSLVDVINIDQVMSVLSPQERAMVLFRLGYLNVWNPLKPDGCVMLNLLHRDERMVVKMLVVLKNIEAGKNWKDEVYEDAAAGLTRLSDMNWISESGLPRQGSIHLRYFSGAGLGLEDCAPSPTSRMGLMALVYAQPFHEDEMTILGVKPTMELAEKTAARGSTTYVLAEPPMMRSYVRRLDTAGSVPGRPGSVPGRPGTSNSKSNGSLPL